ncbi:MAG: phosphotransferase [Dongiaceae bacterium]
MARRDPGAPSGDGPARLLDEALRFVGAAARVPPALIPPPWPSRLGRLKRALYSLRFLPQAVGAGPGALLVHAAGPNLLQGEAVLAERALVRRALGQARLLQPFMLVRSAVPRPLARACAILGIDEAAELRLYLSLNLLLIFFGHRAGRPVVIHLAASPTALRAQERHRDGLRMADSAEVPPALRRLIPELLGLVEREDVRLLTQTRLPGRMKVLRDAPTDAVETAIARALEPLLLLRATSRHRAEGPDHALIFHRFPELPGRWPELSPLLRPLIARLQDWQRRRGLPGQLTHGDYWLRNLMFEGGSVSGIVDWERCRAHGTPGIDALHLALMSLAIERRRPIAAYLEQAWTGRWESDFLGRYVAGLRQLYGLTADDVGHLAGILYLDEFHKRHSAGLDLADSHRDSLLRPAAALQSWLAGLDPVRPRAAERLTA